MSNMKSGTHEYGRYEYLEQLPPIIRRALVNADYDWHVRPFLTEYTDTGSVAFVVESIRLTDSEAHRRISKRERRQVMT